MTRAATTLVTRSTRLALHRATDDTDVDAVLAVFNSNPQWIAAINDLAGKTSYERTDAEMYLWQGIMGEDSVCLEIHDSSRGGLVGVLSWLAPHPRDGYPWLGSLVIHANRQREGLGREALEAVEALLAAEGWDRVRACPLVLTPLAQAFLQSLGYTVVEERFDQDRRRCVVVEKVLGKGRDHTEEGG